MVLFWNCYLYLIFETQSPLPFGMALILWFRFPVKWKTFLIMSHSCDFEFKWFLYFLKHGISQNCWSAPKFSPSSSVCGKSWEKYKIIIYLLVLPSTQYYSVIWNFNQRTWSSVSGKNRHRTPPAIPTIPNIINGNVLWT